MSVGPCTRSPFASTLVAALQAQKPAWHNTMLRVKDAAASVAYYTANFNMSVIKEYHCASESFYFLATVPTAERAGLPAPGSAEAHSALWNPRPGFCTLGLAHVHGTEALSGSALPLVDHAGRPQLYTNGNSSPRGFGHIAFNTDDVFSASEDLEAAGIAFKKRPNEGRMKGLAFCLDPDGYWVELVRREPGSFDPIAERYNLSQTMIRIKDPAVSVPFFRDVFGMKITSHRVFSDFDLFFSATDTEKLAAAEAAATESVTTTKLLWDPCLELTFNHGTDSVAGASYHNGSDRVYRGEAAPQGFASISFLVDDLAAFAAALAGVTGLTVSDAGAGALRVRAPTGYWIDVVQRGRAAFAAPKL
jgi:lactoylglutathione lyase